MKQLNELYSNPLDHVRKTNEIISSLNNKFEDDGTLTFKGDATVWDDLRVEPTARTTGANAPTFSQWKTNGSGSRGIYLYTFDNAAAGSEKEIFLNIQMPHSWAGTDIGIHVHWVHSADQSTAAVRWGLEYSWADIGQVFPNSTIVYSSTMSPSEANLTQHKHYISGFDAITPSGSQDGISSVIVARLFRNSSHANDTSTGDAGLLYIDAHFELNTAGSRTEWTK